MQKKPISQEKIFAPITAELREFEQVLRNIFNPENAIIEKISDYVVKSGGKRLRPALVFLFAGLCGNGEKATPEHHALARAVELIHSATLVHDDIIDDADKRRGLPSVHTKWDTKSAVLAGDFLLAKALEYLVLTKNEKVLELFSKTTQEICRGEVEQFLDKKDLSADKYIERAKRKTGMLFNLCAQGACLISEDKNHQKACDFALNLGIAFQIADDILLFKEDYAEKTLEADFKNSLLTLPVIFALKSGAKLDFEGDFEIFKNQIKKTDAIDKSYEFALKYTSRAMESLANFEDNQYKTSLINLAKYIVEREF